MNEKELLQLKKTIDAAKSKMAEQKGQLSYLMQELEREFDCKTVEEAKSKLAEMESTASKLQSQIESNMARIQVKLAAISKHGQ